MKLHPGLTVNPNMESESKSKGYSSNFVKFESYKLADDLKWFWGKSGTVATSPQAVVWLGSDVCWGTLLAGVLVETQVSSRCGGHQKSSDTDKGILSICISPLATTSPTDWLMNRFMGCVRKGFRLISGICVGLQFDKMLSNLKPYSRFVCLSKVRSSLLQIQTNIKEIQTASSRPAVKTLLSVNPSPHGAMGTLFAWYLVLTELHPIVALSVTTFHLPQAVCPQTLPVGQQLKKKNLVVFPPQQFSHLTIWGNDKTRPCLVFIVSRCCFDRI